MEPGKEYEQIIEDFKSYIDAFSVQELSTYIDKAQYLKNFFVPDGDLSVNQENPLLEQEFFLPARWAVLTMAAEFLRWNQPGNRSGEKDWKAVYKNIESGLKEQMESLVYGLDIDLLTAIGGERYESAAGKGLTLTMVPYPLKPNHLKEIGFPDAVLFKPQMWIRFETENVHALRKQMNMTEGEASLAVCYLEEAFLNSPDGTSESGISKREAGLYSVGILPKAAETRFLQIHFAGYMEWMFCVPPGTKQKQKDRRSRCRLRYRQGRLFLPELDLKAGDKLRLKGIIKKISAKQLNNAAKLMQAAKGQKKGAVLILADREVIARESARLCGEKLRGFLLEQPVNLLEKKVGEKQLLRMSSIDGALLVDLDGYCYACGVILDGKAEEEGNIARGARFNSTKNYVKGLFEEYGKAGAGIVVSEDGMVDIL